MSSSPMYDPGSSEARSSWLAGLTEICAKLSSVLNMKTGTFEDLTLPELFISETDRYRIYQAPLGNKLWMQSPAPIIKKNGVVISPESDYFEIDYLGGSIIFEDSHVCTADDVITASAVYIIAQSKSLEGLQNVLNSLSERYDYIGAYDTLDDLQNSDVILSAGYYAIVLDESTIYIWDGEKWENVNGSIYQYAVDGGYTGTEAEFKNILADAATKKYVDDTVKSGSVKKHIFTVSGPIAADETFILSFSGFDLNPYNGSTIFFGIPINYPMYPSTPLPPERAFQFEVISGWGSGTFTPAGWGSAVGTYNGTLTAKALTELPEGTPAKILWVWI